MEFYLGGTEEAGLSQEEIGAAQSIAMAVSAGRVKAQFSGVERKHRKKNAREKGRNR